MIECCLHRYDLTDGMQYNFPLDGVTATYVAKKDCFIPSQVSHTVVVSRSGCGLPHPPSGVATPAVIWGPCFVCSAGELFLVYQYLPAAQRGREHSLRER